MIMVQAKSLPQRLLISWITWPAKARSGLARSIFFRRRCLFLRFQKGERKLCSRWLLAALTSTPSKPAFFARSAAEANLSTRPSISGMVSGRGHVAVEVAVLTGRTTSEAAIGRAVERTRGSVLEGQAHLPGARRGPSA